MDFRSSVMAIIIVLTALSSSSVFANNFLLGVSEIKEKNYEQAINYFTREIDTINSQNWPEQSKLRIWIGFSHLAAKHNYAIAEKLFIEALCSSLPKNYDINLACNNQTRFSNKILTEQELDRLVAALSVIATQEWNGEDYEKSLARSTLVNTMLMHNSNLKNTESSNFSKTLRKNNNNNTLPNVTGSNNVDYSQFNTFDELLIELNKQEQLAKERMKTNALSSLISTDRKIDVASLMNKSGAIGFSIKKSIVISYTQNKCMPGISLDTYLQQDNVTEMMGDDSEKFIIHLKRIAEYEIEKTNCSEHVAASKDKKNITKKTNREKTKSRRKKAKKLARLERRQGKYFQRLSKPLMCVDKNVPDSSSVESIMRSQYDPFGAFVEASRGNNLLSIYKMAQSPVLDQLQVYFGSLKQYRDSPSLNRDYARFRERVSKCGKRVGLKSNLMIALKGAMKRADFGETYYRKVIDTIIKISENPDPRTINYAIELVVANGFMAEKLLLLGKTEQAIKHYREAINIMQAAQIHPMLIGMLDWTKIVAGFAQTLKNLNRPVNEIHDAITMLNTKHQAALGSLRKITTTNQQQNNLEQSQSALNVKNNNSHLSADFAGTKFENRRNILNENRLFKLGIAQIMLAMDDLEGAANWILSPNDIGLKHITSAYYKARTLSLESYVRANYYLKLGQVNQARSNYALAIKQWYFNPHAPIELVFTIYSTPTLLLEEAANYELAHGSEETAFYYLELARHAFVDSHRLYGRLNSKGLERYQQRLESHYHKLIKYARQNATAQGDLEQFNLAEKNSNTRKVYSSRNKITPLMPLYTALLPFAAWLEQDDIQTFLTALEKFNASWESNKLSGLRQELLTEQYLLAVHDDSTESEEQATEDLFGDEVMFRSARTSNDIAVPSYSISGKSNDDYMPLINYAKVKEQLKTKDTLLSYWVSPDYTYAFAATKDKLIAKKIPTKRLTVPIKKHIGTEIFDVESAKKLHALLIDPFKDSLRDNIILVVNGPLQNVAFSSFVDRSDNSYLGDHYLIRYYPNVDAIFQKSDSQVSKNNQLLILAPGNIKGQDKLTNHIVEAESISKNYQTKVYFDNEVTKSLLEQQLPLYTMVHFAGHASLDTALPDFSRLMLAEDKSGQSSIFVRDIREMDLRGLDLIVLSACETGSTTTFNLNNEFSALNSAFLTAGADSVVATLRLVEDEAAYKLMSQFYAELSKGLPKDKALQRAQQYVRAEGANPKDWSSFVLSGSNRPISLSQN